MLNMGRVGVKFKEENSTQSNPIMAKDQIWRLTHHYTTSEYFEILQCIWIMLWMCDMDGN